MQYALRMNTKYSSTILFFVLTNVLAFCWQTVLWSQPIEEHRILATRSTPITGREPLRSGAIYRLNISGGGVMGTIGNEVIETDALYWTRRLPLEQGREIQNIALPVRLQDPLFTRIQGVSDPSVAGRFFLAVNMLTSSSASLPVVSEAFPPLRNMIDDFPLWSRYALRADGNPPRHPSGQYQATVRGAGMTLSAVWYEDSTSNKTAYTDNFTANTPTQFLIRVVRQTPECAWKSLDVSQVSSDSVFRQFGVWKGDTIDFKTVSYNVEPRRSTARVMLNRALQALAYRIIYVSGDSSVFRIRLGQSNGQQRVVTHGIVGSLAPADSLRWNIDFEPRRTGEYAVQYRVYCQDSTLLYDRQAQAFYADITMRGAAQVYNVSMIDSLRPLSARIGQVQEQTIRFQNTSGRTIAVAGGSSANPSVTLGVRSGIVENNQTVSVVVRYAPLRQEIRQEQCALILSDGTQIPFVIDLQGIDTRCRVRFTSMNRTNDSADFGSLPLSLAGAVRRNDSIWIINTGTTSVRVSARVVNENNPVSGSFTLGQWQSMIRPSDSVAVPIIFTSANDIRVNTARVTLDVRDTTEQTVVALQREIVMIGRSSALAVQPQTNTIRYDSVYVGSSVVQTVLFTNQSSFAIPIESVRFENIRPSSQTQWSVIGELPTIASLGTAEMRFQCRSGQIGRDSARIIIRYRSGTVVDSSIIVASLIGVEQRLIFTDAFPDAGGERSTVRFIRGTSGVQGSVPIDTIDVGTIRLGTTRRVNIIIENTGNAPIQLRTQSVENATPLGREQYDIVRLPLSTQRGETLFPGGRDSSFVIRFAPRFFGTHSIIYTIETDAEDRFVNAPKIQRRVVIRGNVTDIPILSAPADIALGSVATNKRCRLLPMRFAVSNPSNVSVNIRSITLQSNTGEFRLTLGAPSNLQPQSTATIELELLAQQISQPRTGRATVLIVSDALAPNDSLRVNVSADFIPLADSVIVEIADTLRVRPGNSVTLPVVWRFPVQGDIRSLTQATMVFAYNPQVVSLIGVNTQGTASENADAVQFAETLVSSQIAQITVRLSSTRGFLIRDTLCLLSFRTYLANTTATTVGWRNGSIASRLCDDALSIGSFRTGLIRLDSVADLSVLTQVVAKKRIRIQSVAPNPTQGAITIRVTDEQQITRQSSKEVWRLVVYNVFGERIYGETVQAVPWYSQEIPLMLNVPPGMYTIVLQKGDAFATYKCMVLP
jgi:hypothetical protein